MGLSDYTRIYVQNARIVAGYRGETRLFGGEPTVPGTFTDGEWTVATGGAANEIVLSVLGLPSSGGSPITALEYSQDGGTSWIALATAAPATQVLTMAAAGVSYDFRLRAINAVGIGAASMAQSATSGTQAAAVPAAFGTAMWSVGTGTAAAEVLLTVSALPTSGGQPIVALQYTIDGGASWIPLSGTGTGTRSLVMATAATAYTFALRAVNEVGTGPASAGKQATSAAAAAAGNTMTMTQLVSNRVYQRSSATGGLYGNGEASVTVTALAAGALSTVQYRLRDADTDDVIVDWTTGLSAVSTGSFSISVPVPAAQRFYYVDLRPENDSTRAVLGTSRIAAGRVILGVGQSQLGRMFGKVDTAGGTIAALVPAASRYGVVRGIYTGNSMETATTGAGWQVPGDSGAYASAGAPEFLRRQVAQHGVVCAFVGYGLSGGVIAQIVPGGSKNAAMQALIAETGAWEAFWFYMGGSDASNSTTEAAFTSGLTSLMTDINTRNGYTGTIPKIFTATGTRTSETMAQVLNIRRAVAAVAAAQGGTWFEPRDCALYDAVHPSQTGNVTLGAGLHRAFSGAWSQPVLTSATRSGAVITLGFSTAGGTQMAVSGSPVGRIAVYPAGTTSTAYTVSSVTASGTQLTVTLASDPAADVDVWLYPHPDSAILATQFIGDSYSADGYATGRPAQMSLTATTIAAAASVPGAFGAADWSVASGTADKQVTLTVSALPASGGSAITALQYTIDGGATWTALSGTGTGARTLTMAASGTAYTFALRAVNALGNGAASASQSATSASASATVPGAFGAADWTAATAATSAGITFTLTTLPANGGSGITALQYSLDGGTTWASFSGTATGSYTITAAAAGTSYSATVRAVNGAGNGAAATAKTVTSGTSVARSWSFAHDFVAETSGAINGVAADSGELWAATAGGVFVNGTGLAWTGGSGNAFNAWSEDDAAIELDIYKAGTSSTGAPFLLARADTAGTTFYQVGTSQAGTELRIGKTVAGTYSSIVTKTRTFPGSGVSETWRFELQGTALRFYVNGVLELETTDSTITGAGRIGLRNSNTDSTATARNWRTALRAAPLETAPLA